jgi:hypothetical protein
MTRLNGMPEDLRIRIRERLVDRFDARRMGRADLPHPQPDSKPVTPRTAEIGKGLRDTTEFERLSALEDVKEDETEKARLNQALLRNANRQAEVTADKDLILATPTHQLPWEENLPAAVVAARRSNDNRRAAAPQVAELASLRVERDELCLALAIVTRRIEMRWESAAARARRLTERAGRRERRYWRFVCRHHTERAALIPLLNLVSPELPAWAADPSTQTGPVDV